MDKTLLIGNGLNRTLKSSISWEDLLDDIANEYGVEHIDNLPMPLEFERIVNTILRKSSNPSSQIYNDIKKKIANKVQDKKLPANAIQHELCAIPVNAIITTNYDYLLENAYNQDFSYKDAKDKSNSSLKYLWDPTSVQQGTKFYHMHGAASSSASICLGYEHYMGIIEKLRGKLNTREGNYKDEMKIKRIIMGEDEPTNCWGELFYTTNIDIIGLGLTTVESDIWWLLTHRASIYYTNYCNMRKYMKNQITYYDVIDDLETSNLKDGQRQRQKLYVATLSVMGREYRIARFMKRFAVFDGDTLLKITDSVTNGLAPLLGEIFDFSVYLPNKETGKVEMAPPAFTFMPYYIDQDKGWSGLYDSFASINQYKSTDRIKSLYYHLNIYTKNTVELMAKRDCLKESQETLKAENDRLNIILSALREETANLPPADTVSELEAQLEKPKKQIENLVKRIGTIRNEIQSLEATLHQHQYNLQVIREYISAKNSTAENEDHKHHVCPNCGYIFDDEIFDLVRSNYGALNEDYMC